MITNKKCQLLTNRYKNEKGITLVALIVTIIVLIILAAVTLRTLTGEHGILGNAKTAAVKTEYESAKELVKLELSYIQTKCIRLNKKYNLVEIAQGMKESEDITIEKYYNDDIASIKDGVTENLISLKAIVVSVNEYPRYKFLIEEPGKITKVLSGEIKDTTEITDFKEIEEFEKEIMDQTNEVEKGEETGGNTDGETLISKVKENPKVYYGKKVSGYTANGISDWRIFYADDENVFLITSDYITSDKAIACNNTMTKRGKYSVNWNSEAIVIASIANVSKFSPLTSETMEWTGDYSVLPGGRMCSTLLDTNKWTAFLDKEDGTGKGKMAIGSPTLNMLVASWNEKCPNNKIYCNSSSDYYGYYLGSNSIPTGQTGVSGSTIVYSNEYQKVESDNMYFPHKTQLDDADTCLGYWIASKISGNTISSLPCVYYFGQISQSWALAERAALRPVVCLNSDVRIVSSEADDVVTLK